MHTHAYIHIQTLLLHYAFAFVLPLMLWHFTGRQEERPAHKKLSDDVTAWLSVCSEVQMTYILLSSWCHCHPIICCFIKIQTGLTFLVLAYPGRPGKETIKQESLCLCICRRINETVYVLDCCKNSPKCRQYLVDSSDVSLSLLDI